MGQYPDSICGNDDEFYYANHTNPVPVVKYLSDDPADIEIEGDIYEGSSTVQSIEPDIFQYNFNGYSGKFYFRQGGLKEQAERQIHRIEPRTEPPHRNREFIIEWIYNNHIRKYQIHF